MGTSSPIIPVDADEPVPVTMDKIWETNGPTNDDRGRTLPFFLASPPFLPLSKRPMLRNDVYTLQNAVNITTTERQRWKHEKDGSKTTARSSSPSTLPPSARPLSSEAPKAC